MGFTKYLLLASVFSTLLACSQQPVKTQSTSGQSEASEAVNGDEPADDRLAKQEATAQPAPVAKKRPNPYLQNTRSIPNLARNQFARAEQATVAKQWQRAETLWLELQRLYPQLSGSYVNLGVVYRNTNQSEQALQQFAQAVSVNKNNFDAYNLWAVTLREQGEFSEAEKVYRRSLNRWPSQPVVHRNLGILYDLYLQEPANALRHYQLAQSLLDTPDKTLGIWIKDLSRQVK